MSINDIKQLLSEHQDPIEIEVLGQKTGTSIGGKVWAQVSIPDGVFTVYGAENPVPGKDLVFKQASNPKQMTTKSAWGRRERKLRDGYTRLGEYYLYVQGGEVVASIAPPSKPVPQTESRQGRLPQTLMIAGNNKERVVAGMDWFF